MNSEQSQTKVRWSEVMLFLGTTFILTFLLDLAIWLSFGLNPSPAMGILLQLQMLLPAFSAIFFGLFFFQESPLRQLIAHREQPRWFYYYFLVYAVIYALLGGAVISSIRPEVTTMAAGAAQLLTVLGLILLLAVRLKCGKEKSAQAGLSWGRPRYWLLFGAGFILFYGQQTALNYLFHLGAAVDVVQLLIQIAVGQKEQFQATGPTNLLLLTAVQTVLLASAPSETTPDNARE